jgi:hypothetical protein
LGIRSAGDFNDEENLMYHLADQYQKELAGAKATGNPNQEKVVAATYRQRLKELLGLSDNWIAMIERGREPLRREIELYKEKDKVSAEDAEAARETVEAFEHLTASLNGLFRAIGGVAVVKTMADVLDFFSSAGTRANDSVRHIALGFYALTHPLATVAAMMARMGLISKEAAQFAQGVDPVPQWMLQGDAGPPGALGNPGAAIPSQAGGAPAARGSYLSNPQNAEFARNYLLASGLRADQVQGIMAGMAAEGGNLGMGANGAFGIGQWRGDRLTRLQQTYGANPTARQQLAFLMSELRGGDPGGRRVLAAGGAMAVMQSYARDFMRPQGKHLEHIRDLYGDYQRGARYLAASGGAQPAPAGPINVHVDARGATDPHKVGAAVGSAVKHAVRQRHRVVNANTGVR